MLKKKFKRVFLALDTNNIKTAESLIKLLKNDLAGLKIGKELFSNYGPIIIKKLTELASKSNIDGVVCSPSDIKLIREIDKTLLFVTPGIRLNTTKDDHSEVFTPRDAIKLGSNYIVIGRPLTEAKNPMQILHNIIDKIEQIS